MASPSALDQIVKAYDIRGTVPDQLDVDVAYALGIGSRLAFSTLKVNDSLHSLPFVWTIIGW